MCATWSVFAALTPVPRTFPAGPLKPFPSVVELVAAEIGTSTRTAPVVLAVEL